VSYHKLRLHQGRHFREMLATTRTSDEGLRALLRYAGRGGAPTETEGGECHGRSMGRDSLLSIGGAVDDYPPSGDDYGAGPGRLEGSGATCTAYLRSNGHQLLRVGRGPEKSSGKHVQRTRCKQRNKTSADNADPRRPRCAAKQRRT